MYQNNMADDRMLLGCINLRYIGSIWKFQSI